MAETRNQRAGRAKNAPMSVPRTTEPDGEQFLDLIAHIKGRRELYIVARDGFLIRGYGPGDDESEAPGMIAVCEGCHVRAVVDDGRNVGQDATMLALLVAQGRMDIVDAKAYGKSEPHKELRASLRDADLVRQAKRNAHPLIARRTDLEALMRELGALRESNGALQTQIDELKAAKTA